MTEQQQNLWILGQCEETGYFELFSIDGWGRYLSECYSFVFSCGNDTTLFLKEEKGWSNEWAFSIAVLNERGIAKFKKEGVFTMGYSPLFRPEYSRPLTTDEMDEIIHIAKSKKQN